MVIQETVKESYEHCARLKCHLTLLDVVLNKMQRHVFDIIPNMENVSEQVLKILFSETFHST